MQSARDLTDRFAQLAASEPGMTKAETSGLTANEWQIDPLDQTRVLLCEAAFTEWTQ